MYQFILDAVGGNVADARALLTTLFDSGREQFEEMRAAIKEENRYRLSQAAHQLAGATATCGMSDISASLRDIENNANEAAFDEIETQVEKLFLLMQGAEKDCDAVLENLAKKTSS